MTTTKAMRTLADFRRRLTAGQKLLCIHNTLRPVLNGTVREVTQVQKTVGFWWVTETDKRRSHTDYPKAANFTVIDDDTVEWKLFPGDPEKGHHTVRLKFI